MNSFVKQRPTLPLGTAIGNISSVSKAIHCDNSFEVYLLDEERTDLVAILEPYDNKDLVDQRDQWWSLLPVDCLHVEHTEEKTYDGNRYLETVVRLDGAWAADNGSAFADIDDLTLRSIIKRLVQLCQQSKSIGQYPLFDRSLVWVRTDSPYEIIPILASASESESESKPVSELAKLIYYLVAGIDVVSEKPVSLSRWAKNITAETAQMLLSCLFSEFDSDRIDDYETLLEVISSPTPVVTNRRLDKPQTRDGELIGLAKVAGMSRLKESLQQDVISPLRDPATFKRYGLTVPNGILLFGPPGCGKTYISRQLAEELGYFFLEVIPSEVAGMYIHQTVLKIRDTFETAAEHAPSIIFIDEFEALVPSRSELGGHQQYKAEEVNEFLAQLGTCAERNIFLIAATNEPHKIDSAVRRTGRLDKLIYVGPPDNEARIEMLKLHLSNRPKTVDVDIALLASSLSGYSASDIKFLVDEAARLALQQNQSPITNALLQQAIRRVPASITDDDEARFVSFTQRGID